MYWARCVPTAFAHATLNPDRRIEEWMEETRDYGKSLNPILVKNAFIQDQKRKAEAARHWINTVRKVRRDNEQIGEQWRRDIYGYQKR
jgi:hypothetical protein